MKIEIDFSKLSDLRRMEAELETALAAVRGAIDVIEGRRGHIPGPIDTLEALAEANDEFVAPATPADVIACLPQQFSMREAREEAAKHGISDQRMRTEIALQLNQDALKQIEKGRGTRPSLFRKVTVGVPGISGAVALASANSQLPLAS